MVVPTYSRVMKQYKMGDVREDGKVFYQYYTRNGVTKEYWCSREQYDKLLIVRKEHDKKNAKKKLVKNLTPEQLEHRRLLVKNLTPEQLEHRRRLNREGKRRRKAANPEKYSKEHREWMVQKKYGITQQDYLRMLNEQDNKCLICSTSLSSGSGVKDKPHIDHNHTTGAVRGILCGACNLLVGRVENNAELIQKCSAYISSHWYS